MSFNLTLLPSNKGNLAGVATLNKFLDRMMLGYSCGARLTAVQLCIIDGGTEYTRDPLCSSLIELVSWQPLQYLSFRAVKGIPVADFIQFVSSASALSFSSVSLRETISAPVYLPSVTDLVLDNGTQDISRLFSPSGHAPSLRRLSVREGLDLPLVSAAARTLEYLRFGSPTTEKDADPPSSAQSVPLFPFLRSFEIEADFDDRTAP
ncbi:hypothetical protein B0H19DRAFT_1078171 [Mycena capillaripes]|nr:hypothetical protein B0H19DRAFT_1078171 [Mycena capillaripes]